LLAVLVYVALPGWEMATIFLPQIVIGFGNGLLLPTSIAGAVSIRPQVAGTASGVTGFIQMAIGAAAAQLGGQVVAHAAGATPMLLLMLATVPTAPALGISPWVAGITVLLMANGWVLPYQGLEYLVARDATRGEAFSDRQGTIFGAALAITRFVAILVSLPYWRMLGLI